EAYAAFIEKFVRAVKARYPRAVIQWEDLSKDAAFSVLERYRKVLPSFNDDIQGTGAVTLAGVRTACKLRGEALRDQRVAVFRAGAGGAGVAQAIVQGMVRDGLTDEQARSQVYVLDSKGLLTTDRRMEDYKKRLAHTPEEVAGWKLDGAPTLIDTIR